jgi:hypothetical protein
MERQRFSFNSHSAVALSFSFRSSASLPMTDPEDRPESRFASDIGYAPWRESLARGKRKLDLEDCRAIGARAHRGGTALLGWNARSTLSSTELREGLSEHGTKSVIPNLSNRKQPFNLSKRP